MDRTANMLVAAAKEREQNGKGRNSMEEGWEVEAKNAITALFIQCSSIKQS